MPSYNESLKKKWGANYHLVGKDFEETLKLKYCSRSSLLQVLSDKDVQKTNKTQEKKSSVEVKIWKTTGR